MCGIAGVINLDGRPIAPSLLGRMGASIAHRGPDAHGTFFDDGAPAVGLLNRRLAVIDVEGGVQPMSTEDGRHTLVYNGEIYNSAEIRDELTSRGHAFRSRCDTEVVLRGYVEWGPAVLDRLNGMWAIALWDVPLRRLFLARDRLGVKPLVYAKTAEGLVFASEIKALVASGLVDRELDLTALPHYLSQFAVPEPNSLIRGVRRLPSGHYVLADAQGTREVRYWDCNSPEEEDRGRAYYHDEVRGLLEDSVRRRLVSDVPLGVFLSGGVDSAMVATLAARHSSERLRTFTLGFADGAGDERPAARAIAGRLGSRHSEELVGAREAASVLPALLQAHDEPSQSLIQAFFVSRLARRHVTVALSGIGGDELFSSYPTHRAVDLLARLDAAPPFARRMVLSGASAIGGQRGLRFGRLADMAPDARVSDRLMHQTDAVTRSALLAGDVRHAVDLGAPARHIQDCLDRCEARHPLNRVLYLYLKTYLPDELLRTLDSMSMLHSLEARTPLLDYRLIERAVRMPPQHKSSLLGGKVLLREIGRDLMPARWLRRPKHGFSLPLNAWLKEEMTEVLRDVLSDAAVRRRGVFDVAAVADVLDRCLSGEQRLVPAVMMLFAFEQWAQRAFDAAPPPATTDAPVMVTPKPPELSVIIVNWNTLAILRDCLASVARHLASVSHEVLVVDNASADGSADMVAAEFPAVRLIRNAENVGFARANNQAMRVAAGRRFLLLNSDTQLTDDSVARLVETVTDPSIGVAHCRLFLPDGRVQQSAYRFPRLDLAALEAFGLYKLLPKKTTGRLLLAGYWTYDEERDVDWVAGAFMLLPREVYEKTGGFSEQFFMYGEDLEWCQRIADAGWRIRYYPQASIVHRDHASAAQRWGERRVFICIQRQLRIYDQRCGRLKGRVFHAVHLLGSLIRLGYFSVRRITSADRDTYAVHMERYYRAAVKAYANSSSSGS